METQAGFLDRVAGSYWDQVRHVINEWCSHLPASSRPGLRSRLLDRNADSNVYSALWELYLHEMLLGSGYSVEIEQQVGTRGRKPDFLVSRGDEQFVVEAIWTAERIGDPRHGKLAAQLRDAIEKNIQSPDFVLSMAIDSVGPALPPQKRLKSELGQFLSELDYGKVAAGGERQRAPRYTWREAGWSVTFGAIPRAKRSRSGRIISIYPAMSFFRVDTSPVLDAVKRKGGKYGRFGIPYVVAVGCAGAFVEDDDIEASLYGSTIERADRAGIPTFERQADGYWKPGRDDEHSIVSGVLTVDNPAPWTWTKKNPILWMSPRQGALPAPVLPTWSTARVDGALIEREPAAVAPYIALGLAQDWPVGAAFVRATTRSRTEVSGRPSVHIGHQGPSKA
ncbi:hypothetical protein [Amycolatopsis sp. WAC 04197]|uniref:hypothetical protein n=1 Tax=Amycolatopsis sp. WAC 04197 TaxID=2203199 RepID=UPI0018F2A607|nr:hypothetical protein [Amycolatopsis sp. WAC 04197]